MNMHVFWRTIDCEFPCVLNFTVYPRFIVSFLKSFLPKWGISLKDLESELILGDLRIFKSNFQHLNPLMIFTSYLKAPSVLLLLFQIINLFQWIPYEVFEIAIVKSFELSKGAREIYEYEV